MTESAKDNTQRCVINLWQKSAETHMPTTSDTFECYGAMLLETLELCGSGIVCSFGNEPSSNLAT